MPIFHNPNCLYADPIRYCLCEIYSCIYLVYNYSHMNYSIVRVLYIQHKVHVHVVTGIFSLGCTYLQIVLVQFDNNVSTKPEKYCVSCIGNV